MFPCFQHAENHHYIYQPPTTAIGEQDQASPKEKLEPPMERDYHSSKESAKAGTSPSVANHRTHHSLLFCADHRPVPRIISFEYGISFSRSHLQIFSQFLYPSG